MSTIRTQARLAWLGWATLLVLYGCAGKSTIPRNDIPECRIAPSSVKFDTVEVGSQAVRNLEVSNSGGGTLSGSLHTASPDFTVLDSLPFNLAHGQLVLVQVAFHPSRPGLAACTLGVATTACIVTCSGYAGNPPVTAPACSLSAASLDFGQVAPGGVADRNFAITNSGGGTLSGRLASCGSFFVNGSPGYALGPGESAHFTVRFIPADTGFQACSLPVGAPGCGSVAVSGRCTRAIPAGSCITSLRGIDFGAVPLGSFAETTFTAHNPTSGTLSLVVGANCPDFSMQPSGLIYIGANQSMTFTLRFTPTLDGPTGCRATLGSCLSCSEDCGGINCAGIRTLSGTVIGSNSTWTLAQSPYTFSGDVTVIHGATLTIEPGVEIRFQPGHGLIVGSGAETGALVADAAGGAPIRFTGTQPAPGSWSGIEFRATAAGAVFSDDTTYISGSVLRNCIVEYATGVLARNGPGFVCSTVQHCSGARGGTSALVVEAPQGVTTNIVGCTIQDNPAGGIWAEAAVKVIGCTVRNNSAQGEHGGGITLSYFAMGEISGTVITANSGSRAAGLWARDASKPTLRACSITGNNGVGIFLDVPGETHITECDIFGNQGYDLVWGKAGQISIPGNWWGSTDSISIAAAIRDCHPYPSAYGCATFMPVLAAPVAVVPGTCSPESRPRRSWPAPQTARIKR